MSPTEPVLAIDADEHVTAFDDNDAVSYPPPDDSLPDDFWGNPVLLQDGDEPPMDINVQRALQE